MNAGGNHGPSEIRHDEGRDIVDDIDGLAMASR